ncbi:MAG TPA: heavy metal-binding domain-containing protein, partial [Bryobacteraceae bacterium]|nr:heavy metal-binding domain-containing protein [Bryobacteraceae bacterium]
MLVQIKGPNSVPDTPVKHIDPVCGMTVDPLRAAGTHNHQGVDYYFCNPSCLVKFKADPPKFLHKEKVKVDPAVHEVAHSSQIEYTCPMAPEVRQIGPGSCPKCGMALEPVTFTITADEDNPELRSMSRRFRLSAALTSPILALMVSEMLPGRPLQGWLGAQALVWFQLLFATPVVFWGGWPFFVRGWQSVVNRHLNMFTLIALGTGAAYLYSLAATLVPGIFPESFRDHHTGALAVYFEPAAVIVTLVLLGQVLELRARSQTSSAIKALLGLAPTTARAIGAGDLEVDVPLADVKVG